MLKLKNIHKSYVTGSNRLHVLKGIDLHIEAGEMVAIMGHSGSGKSTLMNVLGLLDGYDEGEYHLDGDLMKGLSERRAARVRNQKLGFVFQTFNLLPFKNAVENAALPLYYTGVRRKRRNSRALSYLERVGLADWADHLPSELSGGQQQRVAIARALVNQPKVILADEPTGALDSTTSHDVVRVLRSINAEGTTIVVVTHEDDIAHMTDRIIHLKDGVIEADERLDRQLVASAAAAGDPRAADGAG